MEERSLDSEIDGLFRKDVLTIIWSNLVAMYPEPSLLLLHVNFPRFGLISFKPHEINMSSSLSLNGSWTLEPPLLSSTEIVKLKYDVMIQGNYIFPCL